jgi:hypothetical protein
VARGRDRCEVTQFAGKVAEFEDWLGGLDSNQDSQIQSLESYQLDDLPVVANNGTYIIAAREVSEQIG